MRGRLTLGGRVRLRAGHLDDPGTGCGGLHHERLRPDAGLRRDRLSRRSGLADRGRSSGRRPGRSHEHLERWTCGRGGGASEGPADVPRGDGRRERRARPVACELWRHQEDAGGSGCGRRRCGCVVDPPAAVVVVDPPAAVVVVDPPAAVVVVAELPPAAVVVVAVLPAAGAPEGVELSGGSLPLSVLAPFELDPPPVSPLIHIPKMAAIRTATKSCQVCQDRRSLILSSPGCGWSSDDASGASATFEGAVTDLASKIGPGWSSEPPSNTRRNSRAHHQFETTFGQVVMPFDPALTMAERYDWA